MTSNNDLTGLPRVVADTSTSGDRDRYRTALAYIAGLAAGASPYGVASQMAHVAQAALGDVIDGWESSNG